jgi:gliding motility-associated-like protein
VVFVFSINLSWSQANVPPMLDAIGNQIYCPLSQINVTTSFDIIDPDDTEVEALHIQISTGYVNGQDQLILLGSHPNIIATWNASEGKLSFAGTGGSLITYSNLIVAVNDVVFESSSANVSGEKYFSFTIGDANYLPSTGHYYEYVVDIGITWTNARDVAAARTYFGLEGYLATITSAEEAQLSGEQAAGAGWIGGSDAQTEGVWKWVTGPENGLVFWNGGINGTTPNYANWNTAEPNQAGNEDYAHVTAPGIGIAGSWNDLSNTGNTSGAYQPKGYIVEYGGMPGDPVIDISASTKITIPAIDSVTENEICGLGNVNLSATPSMGSVIWFDALTGGNQVYTGLTYTTPVINTTTSYYVLASVNGCLDGARTQVTAIIKPIPIIDSITEDLVCFGGSAQLFATATDGGTVQWYATAVGGPTIGNGGTFSTPVLSTTTTYYVDATVNGCTTTTRTAVTATIQQVSTPTGNTLQTFCDIENAIITDIIVAGTDIIWYDAAVDGNILSNLDVLASTTYFATQTLQGCESPVRLAVDVIVYETVVPVLLADIPELEVCDTNFDGNDTNGISEFDLTLNESILLNGSAATGFNILYFLDAAYTNTIPNPNTFDNTIANNQTIYVRIENVAGTTCYTDLSIDIHVNSLPVTQPSIVFKNCDEDGIPDALTDFNLNEINSVITNENSAVFNFTYYNSVVDANMDNNVLNPSPYNNQTGNTVYVRVENINTGCYRVSTINLEVSTTSFPANYIEELTPCDNDDIIDGLHVFDLTDASSLFESQFPLGQNLSVHYYRNIDDAQLEENEILNQTNYINETPFSQTLYVRVESDDNGECFGIGPHLVLTVHPRPEFEVEQTAIYCLNGQAITLGTFNPTGTFNYVWVNENNAIVSNSETATVNVGGTYTVVATSIFGCQSFPVSFNVVESAISNIETDDVTIVDLSDNNSITINTSSIGIGDYEFSLDNESGPFKDNPFFEHIFSGNHTLYVRDKNGCGTASLPIFVMGFPRFFTPNNDGQNDTWNIQGLGSEYASNSTVFIYDRYGKFIKQLTPGSPGWNGTFNGKNLGVSDFWFVVNLIDNEGNSQTHRGHFSLVR